MAVWRQSKKIDGTVFNRFVRGYSHLLTLGSRGYFFLIDTDGSRRNLRQRGVNRRGEPFQTVSRVYFILDILRTDL